MKGLIELFIMQNCLISGKKNYMCPHQNNYHPTFLNFYEKCFFSFFFSFKFVSVHLGLFWKFGLKNIKMFYCSIFYFLFKIFFIIFDTFIDKIKYYYLFNKINN